MESKRWQHWKLRLGTKGQWRLRVKIREQLSFFTSLVAVLAAGILALVLWLNNRRLIQTVTADRFSLTASLKAAQVAQAFSILHHVAYGISTRNTVRNALMRYTLKGNNTVENWDRVKEDLEIAASASLGGFQEMLQIVLFDAELGNGDAPGVANGTVIDGMVVGGNNYSGILPNGTRMNVGAGNRWQVGLLNVTGTNAEGIILPGSIENDWKEIPLLPPGKDNDTLNQQYWSSLEINRTRGLPAQDNIPDVLYPLRGVSPSYYGLAQSLNDSVFTSDYIQDMGGLLLGPLIINSTLAIMSITLPVFDQSSGHAGECLGFVAVVLSCATIISIMHDTRGLGKTGQTLLTGPKSVNNLWNNTELSANKGKRPSTLERRADNGTHVSLMNQVADYEFLYILPPKRHPTLGAQTRLLKDYPSLWSLYVTTTPEDDQAKSDLSTMNSEGDRVGVGSALPSMTLNLGDWAVMVEQERSEAFDPISKLERLILGSVFGVFGLVLLCVWPLAHRAVQPLVRLKTATEMITKSTSGESSSTDSESHNINDAENGLYFKLKSRLNGWWIKIPRREKPPLEDDHDADRRREFGIPAMVPQGKVRVHDELTDLTATFNVMSVKLLEQYLNLDDRVRDRTRELFQQKGIADEQRQMAESQRRIAEDANEAKSLFIANISHELRTPLNAILNMCDVAMDQAKDEPAIMSSLEIVTFSGKTLLHLITELLTFSKNQVRGGNITIDEYEFVLPQLKMQLAAMFEKQAADKQIGLKVDWDHNNRLGEMIWYGDNNRILQVLTNLVGNSLKFCSQHGMVQVHMKLIEENVPHASPLLTIARKPTMQSVARGDPASGTNIPKLVAAYQRRSASNPNLRNKETLGRPSLTAPGISTTCTSSTISSASTTSATVSKTYVVEFRVSDNGPGIPEHLQTRIFEPFVQAEMRLSRKHDGVGLGLSICKQIVNMHLKGSISLQSSEGHGATFIIRVPLKFVRFQSPTEESWTKGNEPTFAGVSPPFFAPVLTRNPSSYAEELGTENLAAIKNVTEEGDENNSVRVLVVEDNPTNRTVIVQMLKIQKVFDVTLAKDGREALEKIRSAIDNNTSFGVVLMDVAMPHMDGIECTRTVRKLGYRGPIVALTAYTDDANQEQCFEAGMNDFLVKPIDKKHLKQVLDVYMSRGVNERPVASGASSEIAPEPLTNAHLRSAVGREEKPVVSLPPTPSQMPAVEKSNPIEIKEG